MATSQPLLFWDSVRPLTVHDIASGKVIAEVERVAEESTGRKEFPVVLAERGIQVYTIWTGFSSEGGSQDGTDDFRRDEEEIQGRVVVDPRL
jgi:hypothetical protein